MILERKVSSWALFVALCLIIIPLTVLGLNTQTIWSENYDWQESVSVPNVLIKEWMFTRPLESYKPIGWINVSSGLCPEYAWNVTAAGELALTANGVGGGQGCPALRYNHTIPISESGIMINFYLDGTWDDGWLILSLSPNSTMQTNFWQPHTGIDLLIGFGNSNDESRIYTFPGLNLIWSDVNHQERIKSFHEVFINTTHMQYYVNQTNKSGVLAHNQNIDSAWNLFFIVYRNNLDDYKIQNLTIYNASKPYNITYLNSTFNLSESFAWYQKTAALSCTLINYTSTYADTFYFDTPSVTKVPIVLDKITTTTPFQSITYYSDFILNVSTQPVTARCTSTYGGVYLDNCTLSGSKVINLSFYDVNTKENILVDLSGSLGLEIFDYSNTTVISQSNVSQASICMVPGYSPGSTMDALLRITSEGYITTDWVKSNLALSNTSIDYEVYLSNSSVSTSTLTWVVTDENDDYYPDVIIEMEYYDVATDSYYYVMSETTTSNGEATFSYEASTYYRFKFYVAGSLITTTTKTKIVATTQYMQLIEERASVLNDWILLNQVDVTLSYDNNTRQLDFVWEDSNDYADLLCINITYTYNGTFIESNCSDEATGTYTYIKPESLKNSSVLAVVTGTKNGNTKLLDSLEMLPENFASVLGDNALTFSLIIILVLGLLGLSLGSVGLIVGVNVGLIIVKAMNLLIIGVPQLLGFIVVSILMIYMINKAEAVK